MGRLFLGERTMPDDLRRDIEKFEELVRPMFDRFEQEVNEEMGTLMPGNITDLIERLVEELKKDKTVNEKRWGHFFARRREGNIEYGFEVVGKAFPEP
jgi:hypothetical protein